MQVWEKIGRIYENKMSAYTHAAVPIARTMGGNTYEIIFSARNKQNQSIPFSLWIDLSNLKILNIRENPLLLPGGPGAFDADGVMPTCMVSHDALLYLFYIGWNRGADVPFRNALGVAISTDQGKTFSKPYEGPILDRGIHDPSFVASCDIMKDSNGFTMWYLSGLNWEKTKNQWRPRYHIKYATSKDLITWERTGQVAIDFKDHEEYAISSPRVYKRNLGTYEMWYSFRGGYKNPTYRIGYSQSADGLKWTRMDEEVLLTNGSGDWDSEMICYPYLFQHNGKNYMLYNGNGYGKSGFGLAILRNA